MKNESNFVVSLEGIKLSKEQVASIESGIKKTVMKEIARIDTKGDIVINERIRKNPKFINGIFPITAGLWIENLKNLKVRSKSIKKS